MRLTVNILKDETLLSAHVRKETQRIIKTTGMPHNKAYHKAQKNVSNIDHVCVINTQSNEASPKLLAENIAAGRKFTIS